MSFGANLPRTDPAAVLYMQLSRTELTPINLALINRSFTQWCYEFCLVHSSKTNVAPPFLPLSLSPFLLFSTSLAQLCRLVKRADLNSFAASHFTCAL